ncbi:MAG: Rpn family recombination-promoting nuclease/putative transposase [Myxococcota bacterium]
MRQRQLIRFDWAIKHILRDKANFGVLEGFLSELTGNDIKILEILESESNKGREKDKINRVDIMVATKTGERIIVEVQCDRQVDYLSRILFGTCKVVTETLGKGADYKDVKKVLSVTIAYFDMGQGNDYVYHGQATFTGLHDHKPLKLSEDERALYQKKTIADIYPEYYILRVNSFDQETRDNLDEWVYFLKNEKLPENYKARGLKEAAEKLDVLRLSGRERQEYERYLESLRDRASFYESNFLRGDRKGFKRGHKEGEKKGMKKGMEKGMEKGREEGLVEGEKKGKEEGLELAAARMLKEGMDNATVARVTGLSQQRIEHLSRQEN